MKRHQEGPRPPRGARGSERGPPDSGECRALPSSWCWSWVVLPWLPCWALLSGCSSSGWTATRMSPANSIPVPRPKGEAS